MFDLNLRSCTILDLDEGVLLGQVLGSAGHHALALAALPGVVIQRQAGQRAGPQQAAQVLGHE